MQVSNGLKYGDSEPQTFPVLKQPELLAMLSALGVPCKKDDITKPTLARLWPIYEFFMDQLLGTQEQEEPLERNFAIMEVLEHPGLHAESLNVMVFFRKV